MVLDMIDYLRDILIELAYNRNRPSLPYQKELQMTKQAHDKPEKEVEPECESDKTKQLEYHSIHACLGG